MVKKPSSDGSRDISPARMPVSCILHVSNLVRPFALSQLKQLLSENGEFLADSFWINNIKSHCFVTVSVLLLYSDSLSLLIT